MDGFRFYADLPGTTTRPDTYGISPGPYHEKPVLPKSSTVARIRAFADSGEHLNVAAVLLGREHTNDDYTQEAIVATFSHADSGTSLGSVSREYLRKCRRIPESLARRLHPQMFARLDAN